MWLLAAEHLGQETLFFQLGDEPIIQKILGLKVLRFRSVFLQYLRDEFQSFGRRIRFCRKSLAVIAISLFNLVLVFLQIEPQVFRDVAHNQRFFRRIFPGREAFDERAESAQNRIRIAVEIIFDRDDLLVRIGHAGF